MLMQGPGFKVPEFRRFNVTESKVSVYSESKKKSPAEAGDRKL